MCIKLMYACRNVHMRVHNCREHVCVCLSRNQLTGRPALRYRICEHAFARGHREHHSDAIGERGGGAFAYICVHMHASHSGIRQAEWAGAAANTELRVYVISAAEPCACASIFIIFK